MIFFILKMKMNNLQNDIIEKLRKASEQISNVPKANYIIVSSEVANEINSINKQNLRRKKLERICSTD